MNKISHRTDNDFLNRPEISVIIPVFNTGIILSETINSIAGQTFEDFEIILIDDGSTDQLTTEIINRQTDQRIIIIRQPNAGVAAARNTGIDNARGKYIAFLDHDDLFLPEKLEKSLSVFTQYPDTVLVYSGVIPFGERAAEMSISMPQAESDFAIIMENNPICSMSCVVVKKSFIEQHGIKFHKECVPCDDWDFNMHCAVYGKIRCTDKPLIKYRLHSGNLSANQAIMYNAGLKVIKKYIKQCPYISGITGIKRRTINRSIRNITFRHYYGLAFMHITCGEYKNALKNLLKAFFCRPFKCTAKLLIYISKKF